MENLKFGTGGLRGIMGDGENQLNAGIIRKTTCGLVEYILNKDFMGKDPKEMGIVIAYDSRNNSYAFSKEAALILVANGIKTYIFEGMRSTPELSFAVRSLGCAAGIVITASHNPKEYNGFKVYSETGAQLLPDEDKKISEYSKDFSDFSELDVSLLNVLPKEQDEKYVNAVLETMINGNVAKDIAITYTPLFGTGFWPIREILYRAGFENLNIVLEQAEENGDFPGISAPNPENLDVFEMAIVKAKQVGSDIILATDPDADRLGVMILGKNGEYTALSGNMLAVLMLDYIITHKKMPENAMVVATNVSTPMVKKIAVENNISCEFVKPGFKYVAEKIDALGNNFIFGFEENGGFLHATHTRDKDAISTALLVCEMASYYKEKSLTLLEKLELLYQKYGYFLEKNKSINLKQICDFSRVPLCYNIDSGFAIVRKSGTEPKLKLYFGANGDVKEEAENRLNSIIDKVMVDIEELKKS